MTRRISDRELRENCSRARTTLVQPCVCGVCVVVDDGYGCIGGRVCTWYAYLIANAV